MRRRVLPPFPATLLDHVLAHAEDRRAIDLDDFAELIAPHGLSADAIDQLMAAVEARGVSFEVRETPALKSELLRVLPAAAAFVKREGRRPRVAELAEATGLPSHVVWRALRYGRTLGR